MEEQQQHAVSPQQAPDEFQTRLERLEGIVNVQQEQLAQQAKALEELRAMLELKQHVRFQQRTICALFPP